MATVLMYVHSKLHIIIVLYRIAGNYTHENTAWYLLQGDSVHACTYLYSPESARFLYVSIYVKQLSSLLRWLGRVAH